MLGMNKLCNQQWCRTMGNGHSEANQETSRNKHLNVDAHGLKYNTDDHEDAARDDASSSSKNIGDVGSNRQGKNASSGHDGIQVASSGSAWVVKFWSKICKLLTLRSQRGNTYN
jgi:hypothetical protein